MTLRWRLALVFSLGTAALIAAGGLVLLGQLRFSLTAALDGTLQARSEALAAQLASGSLPSADPGAPNQTGEHPGQFPAGTDEFTQVLALDGKVIYPPGEESPALLSAAQRARAGHGRITGTTTFEGERARILAAKAAGPAGPVITVVGTTTGVADAAQARAHMIILVGGPLAVVAAGLGAWLLTGAALRPVDRMRRRLDEITEHEGGARLRVPATRDEIASLAVTTNRLLDRLQLALARQRGFVADAGHELRTPLTALKAELELAARAGRSPQELAAAVAAAAGDTDRLVRLAEDLLLLARADDGTAFLEPAPIDVGSEMRAVARSFEAQAEARGVTVAVRTQEGLTALADPGRLRQALGNLIDNAIRHSPDGSVVEVTSEALPAPGNGRPAPQALAIEVRDHGPGFAREFLPHAFERFSRARHPRGHGDGGTGLGLAIVASIADAHGGLTIAGNHPDGGARVRMELPLVPADGTQAPA